MSDTFDDRRLARNPIAIVGMSGLLPMAANHREYWQNIVDGTDCTQEVPESRWRLDDYYDADPKTPDKTYARRGAFLPEVDFDAVQFGLPPNQLGVTTMMQVLSLGVARDLLLDAGAPESAWYDPSRTGVVLGTTGPVPLMHQLTARLTTPVLKDVVRSCGLSATDADEIAAKYVKAFAPWEENSFPGLLANVISGRVANRLGLGGMNCTVDAACAASLSAIRLSVAELVDGRAEMMITGGVDLETSIFMYMCFSKVGALSHSDRISPFSDAADGTVLGEGIGMVALKRLSDAVRDGNRIYAVIRGIGSSSDGRAKSIYAPVAEGQRAALDRAYADADCSPASVELFEAHGTGTVVGDKIELSALGGLLRSASTEQHFAALGSVKSQIGHTKGAAGAAGLMKMAFALYHKVLPGTINVETPNSAVDFTDAPFYVNVRSRPWILDPHRPIRRAGVSAMGFGGTNFHFVLEEYQGADRAALRVLHRTPLAYLWHAPDPAALLDLLRSGAPGGDGGDIPAGHARIGFVAADDTDAATLRGLAVEGLAGALDAAEWSHPRGIFFRRSAAPDLRVGALFAGQGSQYLDMGQEAALNNPVVAGAFDEANAFFDGAETRLAQVVFPPPMFDPELRKRQESTLRRTEYAQPAIGALSAGHFRYLAELGLRCAGYAGHSFGELTALWAAGALRDPDYFYLAAARGRAMAPVAGDDAGTMAAIQATREQVTDILTEFPGVVICNHNAPTQVVVGGGTELVNQVVRAVGERGIKARLLPVSAAFHTHHVEHAVDAFRPAVSSVHIGAPTEPVYANSPDAAYGDDAGANGLTLVRQLLEPVEFVTVLRQMRAAGVNVFVEFGPKQVLTQFVRQTLGEDVRAIATDGGPLGDSDVALKKAAVQLAVLGAPLSGINRHTAPALEPVAARPGTVRLGAAEHVPAHRREAYQAALTDGYRVSLPPAPAPSPAPAAPSTTDPLPTRPLPTRPLPTDPPPADPLPARVEPLPAVASQPVPTPVPVSSPPIPADAPAMLLEDPVNSPVDQHLALHSRYLESQLRLAEDVAGALRQPIDPNLASAVAAVAQQSVAIGHAHARASEILAALADLESGVPVDRATWAPTPRRAPAAVPDPIDTELRTMISAPAQPTQRPAPAITSAPAPVPAPVSTPAPAPVSAPPAPAAPVSAPVSAPVAQNGAAGADLRTVMIDVVASMTGYPVAMVDPTLDLEMDLGVDSIKRVQVMSAVQERIPGLPVVGPEELGELRTLEEITAFLTEASGGAPHPAPAATPASAPAPAPVSAPVAQNGAAGADLRTVMIDVVASMTGYPVAMVDPTLDLEMDLGVDSIKRVQVMSAVQERIPGLPTVGPEELGELRTLEQITAFLTEAGDAHPKARNAGASTLRHAVELVALPPVDIIENPYPTDRVAVLVGDDGEDTDALAAGLVTRGWTVRRAPAGADSGEQLGERADLCVAVVDADDWVSARARLSETIMLARWATAALDPAGDRAGFVTVTRLDGGGGLRGRRGAIGSLVGGVSGVVKTLAQERAGLFCRALDIDPALPLPDFVATVIDEIRDAAVDTLEVGVDAANQRWTVVPGAHGAAREVSSVDPDRATGPVAVTGEDLLVVTGGARGVTALCVRALADHTPAHFLLLGRTELAAEPDWAAGVADGELKAAAIAGLSTPGTRLSPRVVSRACADVIATREITATLAALGGRGEYLAVDVTDPAAVKAALAEHDGLITGLVHGAGVLADAMLADKTVEQVETVFRPKLDGLRNVLDALDGESLRHLVFFTSVAGLLGNPGQADYAAANEALCRFAAGWKHTHPGAHVTAIDWSAWDGGMVTPQLRELFIARGVALLAPAAGARAFVEQFTEARLGDPRVLVGSSQGLGGTQWVTSPAFVAHRDIQGLAAHPVLTAHQVGAHPVLPATAALGWLINAVERANPGLCVVAATDYQVHKGVVFDPDMPARPDFRAEVDAGVLDGETMRVRAVIRTGSTSGRPVPRFSATFTLVPAPGEAPRIEVPPVVDGPSTDLYREARLFHGPVLQGVRRVLEHSPSRAVVLCQLPDTDLSLGAYAGRLHSPVLADLLLQSMLVLTWDLVGAPTLPLGIGRAEWYAPLPDDEPFLVVVDDVRGTIGATVSLTATATTLDGRVLARFADVPAVSTPDLAEKFRESVRSRRDADRVPEVSVS